jgi:hypothetical protein
MQIEIPTKPVPEQITRLFAYLREGRPARLNLNDVQRQSLYQMVQHPGYTVLLDMMESFCFEQENVVMNTPPADEKNVLAEHRVGRGMWLFFLKLQNQVRYEINELFAPPEPPAGDPLEFTGGIEP